MSDFDEEVVNRIDAMSRNERLRADAAEFMRTSVLSKYSYNFAWMSRPIIQYPTDMVAMQELIWRVRPDLIIETGIAHGGSLIFSASMLALLDMADAIESGATLHPAKSNRKVLGIDIDIRAHNRVAIEAHPMASRIQMIQGSSIASDVVAQVHEIAAGYSTCWCVWTATTPTPTCWPSWRRTRRSPRWAATAWSSTPSSRTCPPTCIPTARGARR